MGLIKSNQETYGRILNHVCIEEHDPTQINMCEESLWSLKSEQ